MLNQTGKEMRRKKRMEVGSGWNSMIRILSCNTEEGGQNEIFDGEEFKELLKETYEFMEPYFYAEDIPKDCISILCRMYLFSEMSVDADKVTCACGLIAGRFVTQISMIAALDEPFLIKIPSYIDDNGNVITSKDKYYYDINTGDLSDVIKMLEELEEKGEKIN